MTEMGSELVHAATNRGGHRDAVWYSDMRNLHVASNCAKMQCSCLKNCVAQ